MKEFPLMLAGEWFKLDNTEYIWLGNNEALNTSANRVHVLECNNSFTRLMSPEMLRVSFWLQLNNQGGKLSELLRRIEYPKYLTVKDVKPGQKFQFRGVIFTGLEQIIEQDTIKVIDNNHRLCELYAKDIVELL